MIPYKLKNWVIKEKLNKSGLSLNNKAVYFLSNNMDWIDRHMIVANDYAYVLIDELIKKNEIDINSSSLSNHVDIELLYKNNKQINLDYFWLSANRYAKKLLKDNYENLNYSEISGNSGAIDIITNMSDDRIDYSELSRNENAIEFLKNNKSKIDWNVLSGNSQAIDLLAENPDKINFDALSYNYNIDHPKLRHIVNANLDELDWGELSANPGAIDILFENIDRIEWVELCQNFNAPHLLSYFKENINWDILSSNIEAGELLEQNVDKINWFYISSNPCIFEIDYNKMKDRLKPLRFDLMKIVWTNTILNMFGLDVPEDIINLILIFI
jgi:hypothetical protein